MTRTIGLATFIVAFAGGCTSADSGTDTPQGVLSSVPGNQDPSAASGTPPTPATGSVAPPGGEAAVGGEPAAAPAVPGTSLMPSVPDPISAQPEPQAPAPTGGAGGNSAGKDPAGGGQAAVAGGGQSAIAGAGGGQSAVAGAGGGQSAVAGAGGGQSAVAGAGGGQSAVAGAGGGAVPVLPADLPPVAGKTISPPSTPLSVPDGSVKICETGDNWMTLVSQNNIGCAKACQSEGMNCRRSFHDSGCQPQMHPELGAPNGLELGCGQLVEQATDFCACSAETFFQGELYYEHPRTRVSPPLVICQAGEGWATLVFDDKSGCNAACASVGLQCHSSAEDLELECGPQAGPGFKLDCDNTLAHASDFCVCTADGTAAGLPDSVLNTWKPY